MQQINFRIDEDEKLILELLAKQRGQSVAEFTRATIEKEISTARVNLAFQLISDGKIGFKRGWKLSGLSYHQFMTEWAQRNTEEKIAEDIEEQGLNLALNLDPQLLLKE